MASALHAQTANIGPPLHDATRKSFGHQSTPCPAGDIIFVHDDLSFAHAAVEALDRVGRSVRLFDDPLDAYEALRFGAAPDLLITRVQFKGALIHGLTLARSALAKSLGLRVLIVALPEYEQEARKVGTFLPISVTVPEFLGRVEEMLAAG
jgi:hypothetical protein